MLRFYCAIIFGSLLSAYGYAGVTKCTDPEGKVYFTDLACPKNSTEEYQSTKQSSGGFEPPRSSTSYQEPLNRESRLIRSSGNRRNATNAVPYPPSNGLPSNQPSSIGAPDPQPRGAIDPKTGNFYAPTGGGGVVDTKTGHFLTPTGGGGFLDTATGRHHPPGDLIVHQPSKATPPPANCMELEASLNSVNQRLKAGYTGETGRKWKSQRRNYENLLKKYCM